MARGSALAGDSVRSRCRPSGRPMRFAARAALGALCPRTTALVESIPEVNAALSDDPGLLNRDPYGKGWLVKIRVSDKSGLAKLMQPAAYDAAHPAH